MHARPSRRTLHSASRGRVGLSGEGGDALLSTPPAARASSSSLAPDPGEHVEELVDLLLAFAFGARTNRVGDARLDVPAQQELLDLLERALHRRDLEQDVDAVRLAVDHPLETLHLPLDPTQSAEGLGLRLRVDHPIPPRGSIVLP